MTTPREEIERAFEAICAEHRSQGVNTMQCAIDYRLVAAETVIVRLQAEVRRWQRRAEEYASQTERIVDRCPSCGSSNLFIGEGGYLTCSVIGCKEPGVGRAVARLQAEVERLTKLLYEKTGIEADAHGWWERGKHQLATAEARADAAEEKLAAKQISFESALAALADRTRELAATKAEVERLKAGQWYCRIGDRVCFHFSGAANGVEDYCDRNEEGSATAAMPKQCPLVVVARKEYDRLHTKIRELGGERDTLRERAKELESRLNCSPGAIIPQPDHSPDREGGEMKPTVVCLCGSTRFADAFIAAARTETLAGKIVLSVGLFGHAEGLDMSGDTKKMLDELHLRKIDLADEVLILNVGGYVGESTSREIGYAQLCGKRIRFLDQKGEK